MSWNVTIIDNSQIELRKTFSQANVLIIISDGGWKYKTESPVSKQNWFNTKGFDIRMSMNGPAWLTFDDWDDIKKTVDENIEFLIKGKSKNHEISKAS